MVPAAQAWDPAGWPLPLVPPVPGLYHKPEPRIGPPSHPPARRSRQFPGGIHPLLASGAHASPMTMTGPPAAAQTAHARGMDAEARACSALVDDGWTIHARRVRTGVGEVDIVAERDGILAIVEVKARPRLAEAAASVSTRQQLRLIAAAEVILSEHPDWGANGVRFDVLVVDAQGRVRRIADAFRADF